MADDGKREIWATLETSTFDGVPFFVESISISGGRKATAKPIINSHEQVVDDVGLQQRVYNIRGFITARYRAANASVTDTVDEMTELSAARKEREKNSGTPPVLEEGPLEVGSSAGKISDDYRAMRKELTAAFESPGPKTFVHPIEGTIEKLICTKFSIDESMKEVGIGRFQATFVRQTVQPMPKPVEGAAAEVEGLSKVVDVAATAEIVNNVEISAFAKAVDFVAEKLSAVYAAGLVVAEAVETVTDAMDQFQRDIAAAEAAVFGVVGDVVGIAESINGVFESINGLFALPGAAFQALQNGFDFGGLDIDFDFSTPSGAQRKRNQSALNASVQSRYLSQAYLAALDLPYVTTDDVAVVEGILEAQHRKIVDGDEAGDELKGALTDLRESFFAFLGAAKLNARSIVEQDVTTTTPRVLSYMLYEDDEDAATVAGLNDVFAYEIISGAVSVLSK